MVTVGLVAEEFIGLVGDFGDDVIQLHEGRDGSGGRATLASEEEQMLAPPRTSVAGLRPCTGRLQESEGDGVNEKTTISA